MKIGFSVLSKPKTKTEYKCHLRKRTRSDFEKHLTIKNCDKTFLKTILRLKNC